MAKAIANTFNDSWVDVYLDAIDPDNRVGWAGRSKAFSPRVAWLKGAERPLAREVERLRSGRSLSEDVRWILEQIPGCADLEIEWVNE